MVFIPPAQPFCHQTDIILCQNKMRWNATDDQTALIVTGTNTWLNPAPFFNPELEKLFLPEDVQLFREAEELIREGNAAIEPCLALQQKTQALHTQAAALATGKRQTGAGITEGVAGAGIAVMGMNAWSAKNQEIDEKISRGEDITSSDRWEQAGAAFATVTGAVAAIDGGLRATTGQGVAGWVGRIASSGRGGAYTR